MPFGGESTWDTLKFLKQFNSPPMVTNAFRRGVHLGLTLLFSLCFSLIAVTNAFRRGVHLGLRSEISKQLMTFWIVTNAFRRGVHLGPKGRSSRISDSNRTSPMPFGGESTWDNSAFAWPVVARRPSPMPFGGESTWDRIESRTPLNSNLVTNAFRRGVHLGPKKVGVASCDKNCSHQCLSAGSPLGTGARYQLLHTEPGTVTNAFRRGVHLGLQAL